MPYYPIGYDPTIILLIPALILAMYAQFKVSSTFAKFSNVANRRGLTGAEVARYLLERSGITDVSIEHVNGRLTDHYDPRVKVLRLSDAVYNSHSLAAIGVAAHETGHAIQHDIGYVPLGIRNSITPIAGFGSKLAFPLILLGFIFSSGGGIGQFMIDAGIILFSLVVLFQLVTLPVEFNASNRAIELLEEHNLLAADELPSAKKVLSAAALTYVAAAATSAIQLLRLMMMSRSRDK